MFVFIKPSLWIVFCEIKKIVFFFFIKTIARRFPNQIDGFCFLLFTDFAKQKIKQRERAKNKNGFQKEKKLPSNAELVKNQSNLFSQFPINSKA